MGLLGVVLCHNQISESHWTVFVACDLSYMQILGLLARTSSPHSFAAWVLGSSSLVQLQKTDKRELWPRSFFYIQDRLPVLFTQILSNEVRQNIYIHLGCVLIMSDNSIHFLTCDLVTDTLKTYFRPIPPGGVEFLVKRVGMTV